MLPLEPLTPDRIAELRRMTPQERLRMAGKTYWDTRRAKATELSAEHPNWSEDEVETEVKRLFLAEAMKEG